MPLVSEELAGGRRMKWWREYFGLSIRQVATATGIDAAHLWRLENGRDPRERDVRRFIRPFRVTIHEFYGPLPPPLKNAHSNA